MGSSRNELLQLGQISKYRMFSFMIVVLPPRPKSLFYVIKRSKLSHVQTLITQSSINRL
jgi:hypothetical protein